MSLADRYKKWDHIEISDDEDDTHPNVDTPSLFKWRHEARLQRKAEKEQEKAQKQAKKKIQETQIEQLRRKMKELESKEDNEAEKEEIAKKLKALEDEHNEFLRKEAELERRERENPQWDVDNISQEKSNRSIINSYKEPPKTEKQQKEDLDDMTAFFRKYEKEIQEFGLLEKREASHKYLSEHPHLVSEHLGSYLIVWCVDLEVEKKHALVKRVARQCITAQYIMELAKSLKKDPRDCVGPFFVRLATAEQQYKDAFEDEYNSLLKRVQNRAKERIEEAKAEIEKEEREARLGPAGLDPIEVLESLPAKIREAFETQNTPLLQEGFAELSQEDFKYHYDRVVGSGLWVPQGQNQPQDDGNVADEEDEDEFESAEEGDEDEDEEKNSELTAQEAEKPSEERTYVPVEDTVD